MWSSVIKYIRCQSNAFIKFSLYWANVCGRRVWRSVKWSRNSVWIVWFSGALILQYIPKLRVKGETWRTVLQSGLVLASYVRLTVHLSDIPDIPYFKQLSGPEDYCLLLFSQPVFHLNVGAFCVRAKLALICGIVCLCTR